MLGVSGQRAADATAGMPSGATETLKAQRRATWHALGLGGVLLATVLLRFPLLTTIPVGLHFDEAWSGLDAASVTLIHHPIFFTDSNGMEPLYLYLQAISIAVFGRTAFALRVVSAVLGTLTVPALYLLVRQLAGRSAGLFAAAVLAVTYWHVHVSRLGYRAIALPLVECLAWWALWHGVTKRDWRWLALGGGCVGLSLYTYSTARAFPLAVALWFLWLAIRERRWRPLAELVVVGVSAVVVFAPLGWYFLEHPEEFVNRVGQVVVLSSNVAESGQHTVLTGIVRTLGMFSFHGDPQWKYNLSGKPTFDPLMALGFYVGVGVCLWRMLGRPSLQPLPQFWGRGRTSMWPTTASRTSPVSPQNWGAGGDALLVIWFAVMLIPAFVTTDPPETLHTLATVPAVCTFPALGLMAIWRWLAAHAPMGSLARLGVPLATALIVGEGIATAISYFLIWAPNTQTYYWLHGDVADIARRLERVSADTQLYVATEYLKHPTILFLAPQASERITWFDATKSLPIHSKAGPAVYVFAHGYDVLPEAQSALVGAQLSAPRDRDGGIIYHWYALSASAQPPALQTSLSVPLGQDVVLEGASLSPVTGTASGQYVRVTLRWRVLQRPAAKLSLFVHLLDSSGYRWAQADGLGYFSDDWQPGDDVTTTEQVALPPGVPPVPLTVSAGLYDVQTGAVLHSAGAAPIPTAADGGLVLGQVTPVATALTDQTIVPGARSPVALTPGLMLVGAVLPAAPVTPGEPTGFTIYVEKTATGAVQDPALILSGIAASDLEPVPMADLLKGLPPGSLLAIRHVLTIPTRAPDGDVILDVQVPGGAAHPLGAVPIRALPRDFAAPSPEHTLSVRFGDVAELLGYDLTPVRAGSDLTLTLYWRALGAPDVAYTVFTHLVSADGKLAGQHDGPPAAGRWPTTAWLPGQVIVDRHTLRVDPAARGSLTVQVGLYDARGTRLPASGPTGQAGDSYVALGPIDVP